MTATIDFTTVTNAIEALVIAGVTVRDVDEMSDAIGEDYAVLSPLPPAFISNVVVSRDELTGQKLRVSYTLTYRYYHCRVGGSTSGLSAIFSGMVTNAAAILVAFSSDATLAGAMDNEAPTLAIFGYVADGSNMNYHGFDVTINVMQFLDV